MLGKYVVIFMSAIKQVVKDGETGADFAAKWAVLSKPRKLKIWKSG